MSLIDYLAAEPLIIDRIKDQVKGVTALNAADLAGVIEASQITPAAHVLYAGDRLGDSAGKGSGQAVFQQWMIVLVVKHAKDQRTAAAARTLAGPYILTLLKALQGWQPSDLHQPMKRVTSPKASYRPGGFAYFPLMFETRINT